MLCGEREREREMGLVDYDFIKLGKSIDKNWVPHVVREIAFISKILMYVNFLNYGA